MGKEKKPCAYESAI